MWLEVETRNPSRDTEGPKEPEVFAAFSFLVSGQESLLARSIGWRDTEEEQRRATGIHTIAKDKDLGCGQDHGLCCDSQSVSSSSVL